MESMTSTDNDRAHVRALSQGMNLTELRKRLDHLEALYNRKQEASQDYRDAAQIVAIECGVIPGVLNQFVAARCSESVSKKARSAEQLSLLFGEEI